MNRHALCPVLLAVVLLGVTTGCRTVTEPPAEPWDSAAAQILEWRADDARFNQDHALETSGLAWVDGRLIAPAEKYARLLFLDPGDDLDTTVLSIGVPRHAELEGLAWHDGSIYLCDEAHAAVYRVDLEGQVWPGNTPQAVELPLEGIEVVGSKIGVEGIEVSHDGEYVHLLLERSGNPESGCVSRLWLLRVEDDRLVAEGDPIDLRLEDCNWRLTGLAWREGRLMGLKTQYPGERYEVVAIDQFAGTFEVVQDLTELLRGVRSDGWGNNVEGIAFADDGALWLIGDNAVTGIIDDPYPPPTDERAVLIRIPPSDQP